MRSLRRRTLRWSSIEKKKRVQMHLEHARKHALTACRFADSRMASREIKGAVAELTQAIELLTDI